MMDKWFNSKWFVRAVSLAFAILIYVFVNIEVTTSQSQSESRIPSASEETQTLNDIPLDIRIDSEKYVVSGVPEYVTVSLEGPTAILTSTVMQRNFDVFVDLTDLGEGTHTVNIEHSRISEDINVYIDPKTIVIRIEERAMEEFPVTVDFINQDQLPTGYELGEVTIEPETVQIISSRSVVDQVAMVKAYIDVSGLRESVTNREVPVNVYDSQGNGLNVRIEPTSVVVSVDIQQNSKTVPIEVNTTGELPEGFELISAEASANEVEVFGSRAALAEIEQINTEEIDLSELNESGEIEVKLDLPENTVVNEENIAIDVELAKPKLFEDMAISVKKTDDQSFEFLEPTNERITIRAVGSDKVIDDLSADQITVSVNIEGLVAGDHQLAVDIEGPDDMEYTSEDGKVRVRVQ